MNDTRKNVFGFASYDFANSGYVVIFQSFLFPLYLASLLHNSETLWPLLVSASSLAAVLVAPFVGRIADLVGKSVVFTTTVVVTAAMAAASSLLFPQHALVLALSFVTFNTVFELSQSLYDSFLVNITTVRKRLIAVSTFSWGFGYLGGAAFLGLYFVMKAARLPQPTMLTVLAASFLVLSMPAIMTFRLVQGKPPSSPRHLRPKDITRVEPPVPWSQLVIYWIIADCVAAVMYFAPMHIKQNVGLSLTTLGGLMLGGQMLSFPLTIVVGRIATRVGVVRTIRLSLLIWALALLVLYLASTVTHVVFVMLGLSLVLGSTQALLRSHFATRISVDRSGEGMGFYAIAQKSASLIAPILVAVVAATTGSIRPAFGVLASLMVVALILTKWLPDQLVDIKPEVR